MMNPKLKWILDVSAKHAVNAVLTNSGLMLAWHDIFNLNNWAGVLALVKATAIVVVSRELAIWFPKLLKWSQSTTDDDGGNPPAGPIGSGPQSTGKAA